MPSPLPFPFHVNSSLINKQYYDCSSAAVVNKAVRKGGGGRRKPSEAYNNYKAMQVIANPAGQVGETGQEASIVILRLSYRSETVLSNKITRNRIVLSFKDSPRKPLGRRPRNGPLDGPLPLPTNRPRFLIAVAVGNDLTRLH